MLDTLREWWGPIIGGAGMFASYIAGKERNQARLKEVTADLSELQKDFRKLNETVANQSSQLAAIGANIEWLKKHAEKR